VARAEQQSDPRCYSTVHGIAPVTRKHCVGHASKVSPRAQSKLKVLLIEDNPADAELVLHELRRGGFHVANKIVETADGFRKQVRKRRPDLVLANYNVEKWRSMEALDILRLEGLDIPFILVSSTLGDAMAVECLKQGASDYVLKESLARLPECVKRALEEARIRQENRLAHGELRKKLEELARSNAELEQFACAASHDLQEPLRMVIGYTQLLAERYRGKLDIQGDSFIQYAVDGALRMRTLIQDLMVFSCAGQQAGSLTNTDCNQAVREALGNLQFAVRESGAIVTSDDLPVVLAKAGQLRQVFQNLIGNAIKFRSTEAPVIHVGNEWTGIEWLFSVSDNGISIAPADRECVFAVFRRLHTQTEYSGNGLGLAICKRIVEQAGGAIWVESQAAPGTTIKLTWPAMALGTSCVVLSRASTERTRSSHSVSRAVRCAEGQ
jgi:signal transduction histidine kinase